MLGWPDRPSRTHRLVQSEADAFRRAMAVTDKMASLLEVELDLLPALFAVVRFDHGADIPDWALGSPFVSVTRTNQELSIICHEAQLPSLLEAERGFRCLGVRGPLSFSQTGILASLANPLAAAGVSLLALSTYDTDYVLVKGPSLDRAVQALTQSGHTVFGAGA